MSASELRLVRRAGAVLALALCTAGGAWAQSTPTREQEQLRRLRQQLQQAQQESQAARDQARVAAEEQKKSGEAKAALEDKAKRAGAALGAARAEATAQTRRVAELEAELATVRAERDQLQARLTEATTRLGQSDAALREHRERLAARETALGDLEVRHKLLNTQYESVVRNNIALYQLGNELLARYENKGVAEAIATREPFLQFKRVALENLVQDYRDKLDAARVAPPRTP